MTIWYVPSKTNAVIMYQPIVLQTTGLFLARVELVFQQLTMYWIVVQVQLHWLFHEFSLSELGLICTINYK